MQSWPLYEPWKPSLGLILVSSLLIFSPLQDGGTTHLAVMVIRLHILALLTWFLWKGTGQGSLSVLGLPIGLPMGLFLGLATLSTIRSPYTTQSLQWLFVIGSYSLFLYLLVYLIDSWKTILTLSMVFVCMGTFEASLALVQEWGVTDERPVGTFFNPNFLAGYIVASVMIVLGRASYLRQQVHMKTKQGRNQLLQAVAFILLLALLLWAVVLTASRGATLALLVGSAFIVWVRFGWKGLAYVAGLFVAGMILPTPLRDRVLGEHFQDPFGYSRWQIWISTLAGMIDHPFGIGLGLFQYVYPRYAFPVDDQIVRYGRVATTAHNEYLQIGLEMGAISIAVLAWGVACFASEAKRVLNQRLTRSQRGLALGLIGALVSILVHAGVDSNLHEPALAIVLVLCAGLILSFRPLLRTKSVAIQLPMLQHGIVRGAMGLLLVIVLTFSVVSMGMAWTWFEKGERRLSSREYEQAQMAYETAIHYDPGRSNYHSALALAHFRLYEETGNAVSVDRAVSELMIASQLNPLDGRIPGVLGRVLFSQASKIGPADMASSEEQSRKVRLFELTDKAYRRAIELEPYVASHYFQLAILVYGSGDVDGAIKLASKAVDLEPNYLSARAWLMRRYLDVSDGERAKRELSEIVVRQERFASRQKNRQETEFLSVNVHELEQSYARRMKT